MSELEIILIVTAVILLPVIWFLGSLIFKILWGMWPLVICFALAVYGLMTLGIEYMVLMPVSLIGGIIGNAIWQRTNLFLAVDRRIEKMTFLD